jgi:hypothetical protein
MIILVLINLWLVLLVLAVLLSFVFSYALILLSRGSDLFNF